MAPKLITGGFFDRLQYETDLAEREQREAVRSGEIDFLDQTKTHAEFCQAMRAKNELLTESPDTSLDECSYRDYRLRRATGEGR